ncbi:terminase large subunit [Salinisphaera orenii]|uniref:Terminase n=1 Tax=Salinisphaera orenii YIM 95161 TaxID=1051139 RepID=A0A423PM79_9GAMM|nr:terminase TerL endonuclease subunit [Salinisphaera halophila]ROO26687.1 terminase [Salinisphaera halophila YIM 95161]
MGRRGPGASGAAERDPSQFVDLTDAADWREDGIDRAEAVIRFVEQLPITAGVLAGERMRLRDWQREIVRSIYATDDDNRRIKRSALITLPRKNGKTQVCAALALAHLCGPEAESRGQIISAAADREQAAIIFEEMRAMIERHPELTDRCNIRSFNKLIEDDVSGSTYRALSADARTKHGLNASFVIYDELAQAPNRNLYDVLATSTAARAEPLFVTISTQSPDPNHVLSELVAYGRKVLDGSVDDPTFHATIYAAPDDADWLDENVWHACNPALGDFRSLEEMRVAARQAQHIPARESSFRALYLNQPVEADHRFIAAADWDGCRDEIVVEALKGRQCVAGLDLSATRDLTALVLYFPDSGAVVPYFWAPGERMDVREETDRVPYRTWQRQGLIEAAGERAIDKRAVALRIGQIAQDFDLTGLAFDRWGFDELNRILDEEGIDGLPLVEFGQGFKDMSPAVSALERAVLQRTLIHDGNPCLAWNMSNIAIDEDPSGNRKITKSKSRDKVDGAVALAMAVGLAAKMQPAQEYDFDRDLVLEI